MHATAMALSDSNVLELTGRHLKRVNTEISLSQLSQRWVGRLVAALSRSAVVYVLEGMARNYADDAIWFKGAAKEAWDENIDVRSSIEQTVGKIETLKARLMVQRQELLDLQKGPRVSTAIRQSINRAVASAADLFDALEALRWTMMELEANYSPRSEGWVATTPEELDQLFARLALEE